MVLLLKEDAEIKVYAPYTWIVQVQKDTNAMFIFFFFGKETGYFDVEQWLDALLLLD